MFQVLDPSNYVRLPFLNRATVVSLSNSLIAHIPKDAPPDVQKAAANIKAAISTFQQHWSSNDAPQQQDGMTTVLLDRALDATVGAIYSRIEACERLPVELFPKAAKATELRLRLFPEGLSFLKKTHTEEWGYCQAIIERIDSEGLAADLEAVAGPEFLQALRTAHENFGRAIGKSAPRPVEPESANLLDSMREVSNAIRSYALKILASVDTERPETLAAARAALKPIDDL
ncbi:MAG TPA: hypothetical protein DFS52_22050, partial [Myxococcales bacterium]|nr:hypothetical protein [Myxococcales bacterium]